MHTTRMDHSQGLVNGPIVEGEVKLEGSVGCGVEKLGRWEVRNGSLV